MLPAWAVEWICWPQGTSSWLVVCVLFSVTLNYALVLSLVALSAF